MDIYSATLTRHGSYAVLCDEGAVSVPQDEANRHYAALQAWIAAGGVVGIEPEPPAPVPQVVSRFQARAALHLAGLLTGVETLMASPETDMLARLAWSDAQEFRRNSPTIAAASAALEITEEQLDELFRVAAGIEA